MLLIIKNLLDMAFLKLTNGEGNELDWVTLSKYLPNKTECLFFQESKSHSGQLLHTICVILIVSLKKLENIYVLIIFRYQFELFWLKLYLVKILVMYLPFNIFAVTSKDHISTILIKVTTTISNNIYWYKSIISKFLWWFMRNQPESNNRCSIDSIQR